MLEWCTKLKPNLFYFFCKKATLVEDVILHMIKIKKLHPSSKWILGAIREYEGPEGQV